MHMCFLAHKAASEDRWLEFSSSGCHAVRRAGTRKVLGQDSPRTLDRHADVKRYRCSSCLPIYYLNRWIESVTFCLSNQ